MNKPKKPYMPIKPSLPQRTMDSPVRINIDSIIEKHAVDRLSSSVSVSDLISELPKYISLDKVRFCNGDSFFGDDCGICSLYFEYYIQVDNPHYEMAA